jgi:hypothetical protein
MQMLDPGARTGRLTPIGGRQRSLRALSAARHGCASAYNMNTYDLEAPAHPTETALTM